MSIAPTATLAPPAPHPPAPPVTEFDLELESERARWLRRRFLYFCALNIVIYILFFLAFAADIYRARPVAQLFNVLDFILVVGGYVAAYVYVRRRKGLRLDRLLKLALYITSTLPALSMVFTRLDILFNRPAYNWMSQGLPPGAIWAIAAPFSLFISYSIACALIPWTITEAIKPAIALLAANAAIVTFDLVFTLSRDPRAAVIALTFLTISPLAVIPGLLICYLRYSRFRRTFETAFEAASFRKLQKELAGARRLHEAALPAHSAFTTGPVRLAYVYEPMRQIGGDILYVHPPDDPSAPTLWIVLIDVNGHGISAALMANRVIGEIQRLFAEHPDATPHFILSRLNRYVFLTMSRSGVYATAILAKLDTQSNILQYANAGHPPAFLHRKSDGAIEQLDSDTYLLGAIDDENFCKACNAVPFHPGDSLLAYTDGATEAKNLKGHMLTIEGLRQLLAQTTTHHKNPATWPTHLLRQVTHHRRSPPTDDTLLLTLYRA